MLCTVGFCLRTAPRTCSRRSLPAPGPGPQPTHHSWPWSTGFGAGRSRPSGTAILAAASASPPAWRPSRRAAAAPGSTTAGPPQPPQTLPPPPGADDGMCEASGLRGMKSGHGSSRGKKGRTPNRQPTLLFSPRTLSKSDIRAAVSSRRASTARSRARSACSAIARKDST